MMETVKNQFWKNKKLEDFSQEEWEALCDGCGRCCYRKIVTGWLWWKRVINTRVACDLLDTKTCRCRNYNNRFLIQTECTKLDKNRLEEYTWLPETCAYRLIFEGKNLFPWHPLISGRKESVKEAGICIEDGINEFFADGNWDDYVI